MKQETKLITVKIDPRASTNTIPSANTVKLPKQAHQIRISRARNLLTYFSDLELTWLHLQLFPGQLITKVQHKTKPTTLPIHFYIFKDETSPQILISYAASDWLGILEIKITNEAPTTHIKVVMALNEKMLKKKVTFGTPRESTQPASLSQSSGWTTLKPAMNTLTSRKTSPDVAKTSPPTTVAVHDILALKCAFPLSFNTVGDIPVTYTICADPSMPPVQHPSGGYLSNTETA